MLSKASRRLWPALSVLTILAVAGPVAAQCTVGEIISQMASSSEAMELSPPEGLETLAPAAEGAIDETPEFVFTPEIRPDQRRLLRRVGQACSWISDVPNCTFRRVSRMALKGRNADFIYDKCTD